MFTALLASLTLNNPGCWAVMPGGVEVDLGYLCGGDQSISSPAASSAAVEPLGDELEDLLEVRNRVDRDRTRFRGSSSIGQGSSSDTGAAAAGERFGGIGSPQIPRRRCRIVSGYTRRDGTFARGYSTCNRGRLRRTLRIR